MDGTMRRAMDAYVCAGVEALRAVAGVEEEGFAALDEGELVAEAFYLWASRCDARSCE
jgi:hypothetical protein